MHCGSYWAGWAHSCLAINRLAKICPQNCSSFTRVHAVAICECAAKWGEGCSSLSLEAETRRAPELGPLCIDAGTSEDKCGDRSEDLDYSCRRHWRTGGYPSKAHGSTSRAECVQLTVYACGDDIHPEMRSDRCPVDHSPNRAHRRHGFFFS